MLNKKLLLALSTLLLLVFEAQAQVELVTIKDSNGLSIGKIREFHCSDSIWSIWSGYYFYTLSTDFGNTWKQPTKLPPGGGFAISGTKLFSGGTLEAFASTNLGQSWFPLGSRLAGIFDVYTGYEGLGMSTKNDSLYVVRREGYYLSLGRQNSVYFYGIDSRTGVTRDYGLIARNSTTSNEYMCSITGATFIILNLSQLLRIDHNSKIITSPVLDSISVNPESIIETSRGNMLVGTRKGLFRSLDKGFKWSKITTPLEPNIIRTLTRKGERIFAGLWPSGEIWSSNNDGITWNRLYLPTFQRIQQIQVSGEFLTILANDSLWRVPLSALSPLGLAHTSSKTVLSCTPSTLNNAGLVKYQPEEAGLVTIEIVDVLGRRVKQIFEGVASSEPLQYSFSVEDLPNGVYQIIARSASSFQGVKITVIK